MLILAFEHGGGSFHGIVDRRSRNPGDDLEYLWIATQYRELRKWHKVVLWYNARKYDLEVTDVRPAPNCVNIELRGRLPPDPLDASRNTPPA